MTIQHMQLAFDAAGLPSNEKLLLLAYCNHTDAHGYCWPGQKRLADETGMSPATVKRVNASLKARGLIKSIRRINPKTGNPISNLTRVNVPLLASLKRPERDYDDNMVEAITFGPEDTDRAADLLIAQSEPYPGLNLSPSTAQSEPEVGLNLSPKTSVEPSPETSEETSLPLAVGDLRSVARDAVAADAERLENPGDDEAAAEHADARTAARAERALAAFGVAAGAMPAELLAAMSESDRDRLVRAVEVELEHRTPQQLAARIRRRLAHWRGREIRRPVAVALTVIQRGYDCPRPECEDHVLPSGADCTACNERGQEINERRRLEVLSGTQADEHPPAGVPAPEPAREASSDEHSGSGCPTHPGSPRRHTGECAGCWVDRIAIA